MKSLWKITIVSLLMFVVSFGGATGAMAQKTTLAFGTAANVNTYYFVGAAVATLINKYIDDVECNVEVTSGVEENLTLLMKGEAQLGMANAQVLHDAYHGIGKYEKMDFSKIRVLMAGHSTYHYFYTPADSPIKELMDIKDNPGIRIALGVRGAAGNLIHEALLTNMGIDLQKDVDYVFMTNPEQVRAMQDGQLMVGRCGSGLPAAPMIEITTAMPIRLLEITEEMYQEYLADFPFNVPTIVPAGTYKGQDKDIQTIKGPSYICVRDDMPDELVVKILDVILEKNEELASINRDAGEYKAENATALMDVMGVPFHRAAEEYWKSKGVF